MDADDEPAMAYFLPNGIADDSPPKHSRLKASFGPIGGRSAASSAAQSTAASSGSSVAVSSASGGSNAEFSGLNTRPRPTLEPSPFGVSGAALSPRPTNFLLSDLGGEIHTPRAPRDFGESDGTRSSSPFGYTGSFGPGLGDARHGGSIGAGAIRSPSSMFDRGQEAAKSFSMSPRAAGPFNEGGNTQLYRGTGSSTLSYLNSDSDRLGAAAMHTWPSSATELTQPRRVLQRPPGLAGPPGLGEPAMDGLQPRIRLGSGAGSGMMQRQFGPFRPSASSPMAASGAGGSVFSSTDDQFGPSMLPQLSGLRLSSGVFGDNSLSDREDDSRGVSNPELAELNTQSIKVGEMEKMRSREPTTSRRIDVQARSNTPRSPMKSRDRMRKSEVRSDLRSRALEFSMEAIGAFTPESPVRARRADRGRKMASPVNTRDNSPSSFENSRNSSDHPTPRGKRRNHIADRATSTSSSSTSGTDGRRKAATNQNEEERSSRGAPPGLEFGDNPIKPASRDYVKLKRREGTGEAKASNRSVSLRKSSTRGTEKGSTATRRQVYREKQVKEIAKESPSQEVITPNSESSSLPSASPKESGETCEDQNSTPKYRDEEQVDSQATQSYAFPSPKHESLPAKSMLTVAESTRDETGERGQDKNVDVPQSVENNVIKEIPDLMTVEANTGSEAQKDTPHGPDSSAERESSTSSDSPEGDHTAAVDEQVDSQKNSRADSPGSERNCSPPESSESDAERTHGSASQQPTVSTKKSKRKTTAAAPAPASASLDVVPPAYPEISTQREPSQTATAEKKHTTKESRKDRSKKDKAEKKKATRGKKDKRGSSLISKAADALNDSTSEAQDMLLEALASTSTPLSTRVSKGLRDGVSAVAAAGLLALLSSRRGCIWLAGRLNVKGVLATTFSYVESVLAVVFSVVLLLSLHAASWFIRIHRVAFRAVLTHRHIGFCFAFLYGFPFLVQYVFPWAPPWAPVCLWYAFLVQLFCTNGPTAMVTTFRVILPLVFLVEGISHHSFLLDLNGAELLLASFIISALKTSNLCSPIFFLSLATQCLLAVFLGSELVVQWLQLALALYSLHVMAATDDEWVGMGDEEDEFVCHPAMHNSIADYNHHPAPSSAVSIQKTKRLDRRALAYVRGRKLR